MLEQWLERIGNADSAAMEAARRRWNQIAKPLGSLGLLEDAVVKIAGVQKTADVDVGKKALLILCADNGIVEEGVTQTGREVTAAVARNFAGGRSCVCLMAARAGVDVYPVDIGVAEDVYPEKSPEDDRMSGGERPAGGGASEDMYQAENRVSECRCSAGGGKSVRVYPAEDNVSECRCSAGSRMSVRVYPAEDKMSESECPADGRASEDGYVKRNAAGPLGYNSGGWNRKIARGTRNFLREPAMTREETLAALETGIGLAGEMRRRGYRLLCLGEMGIGNTTTSSAVASVFLGAEPASVTGRGAGLSGEGLRRKQWVIEEGIRRRKPDPTDPVDVLSKVGGLDLAGLTGVCLGGAVYRVPVVLDGVITAAAALAAARLCPAVTDYLLASHVSAEPAGRMLLEELGLHAAVTGGLCLGEGTGAMTFVPMLDMAADVYRNMSTFAEIEIEAYHPMRD